MAESQASHRRGRLTGRRAGERDSQPFDERDLADLISHRSQVLGTDGATPLLAVSRSGMRVSSLTALGPQELLDAWR